MAGCALIPFPGTTAGQMGSPLIRSLIQENAYTLINPTVIPILQNLRCIHLISPMEAAMRKSTRSFVTLAVLLVLFYTLAGTAFAAPAPKAKWTVMVYISGDNNLED